MTDWRAVAIASGYSFPENDLNRIVPVLEFLESNFTPLLELLDYTTEPAVILSEAAVVGQ